MGEFDKEKETLKDMKYDTELRAYTNENKDYQFAYDRYKNSTLVLEEQFARPFLEKRLASALRKQL